MSSRRKSTVSERRSFDEFDEQRFFLEEHERLSSSLTALTRHFAHVQLRLQQVVSAPTVEDRENLLIELNEFASRGIPEIICQSSILNDDQAQNEFLAEEKERNKKFLDELKSKLDEFERYAAAAGSFDGPPTSVVIEKQKLLIDQLRTKLDLQLDDSAVSKLSAEEMKKLVDQAIHQLTNPVKLKENLINQMQTQINDLEKFIDFLKVDASNALKNENKTENFDAPAETKRENFSMKKFLVLTQLYTFMLLSCGTRSMQTPSKPPADKEFLSKKHFGDLRANLDGAIEKLLKTVENSKFQHSNELERAQNEEEKEIFDSNEIIRAVRQDLAVALRSVLEHGLFEKSSSTSLVVFGCFSGRSKSNWKEEPMEIWKLFLHYFNFKNGENFVNSPTRKLSQSFSLNVVGGRTITLKQSLLSGIEMIGKINEKHPRPMENSFKSFLCFALNEKKLVGFLRLILKNSALVENFYHNWSFTRQNGFNDVLNSLNRLTNIDFHLPLDLSVRRFLNNRDLIE